MRILHNTLIGNKKEEGNIGDVYLLFLSYFNPYD